eukprot:CAMPEP_0202891320 /NCGR_PEP_ID=MMETSP1392-20130828/1411_1 /ASSEMBLY_ACC=CAM_ASM_000868 /TAXON_ID=225041 /ORGANISM="Chlamydomonas chlamydogama, Strain SAG 11-48b" /LENGTH=178 /DNA_ID=CAMNT_0049575033 /DNA_START=76 /DNA_END=612 /DNA_ORIENTATION=+
MTDGTKRAADEGAEAGSHSAKKSKTEAYALNVNLAVDKAHEGKSFKEISELPPSALQGIAEHTDELFEAFKIKTISDLGNWKYFKLARAITVLADVEEEGKRSDEACSNINAALDQEWETKPLKEIAAAPVSALQGLAGSLKALHVKTIADLAKLKYCLWAEALTTLAEYENADFSSK